MSAFVRLADMVLRIELEAELGDKIELRLQEVDVTLFVVHQRLEQVARDIVLDRVAMGRSLLVEFTRIQFSLQVALDDFLDGSTDMERFECLHIRKAVVL